MKNNFTAISTALSGLRLKHSIWINVDPKIDFFVFGKKAIEVNKKYGSLFNEFRIRALNNDVCPLNKKEVLKFNQIIMMALENNLFFRPAIKGDKRIKISQSECIKNISTALEMWRPIANRHDLFNLIAEKPAAYLAYLIEITAFTKGAYNYMDAGVINSRIATKAMLAKWRDEEKDHYKDLLQGLYLSEEEFQIHDLNEGTIAILSFLELLGAKRPRSLAIAGSLFESIGKSKKFYRAFYSRHTDKIKYNPKPFYKHHFEDLTLKHHDSWRSIIPADGLFETEISEIITDIHSTKHMMGCWYSMMELSFKRIKLKKSHEKLAAKILLRPKPVFGAI